MELPPPLIERLRRARFVVEVGAGARFDLARAVLDALPEGARLLLTDVDARVLDAPAPARAVLDDATAPDRARYEGADLVLSVRPPEELQLSIARLARAARADLALRPLKDEWADVSECYRRSVMWPDGWRYFPFDR